MKTQLKYDGWKYNIDKCKERMNGKDGNMWMNARTMNQNTKSGH
jgi:hypothetical protein